MRFLPIIARILLGLIFFVFGLNGLLHFIPNPKEAPPEAALAFVTAMLKTGYFLQLLGGTQALAGFLLLINRFVPLALTVLAPVIVNIIAFHAFLAPTGFVPGAIALVLEIYLAWAYRDAFRSMLAARCTPTTS